MTTGNKTKLKSTFLIHEHKYHKQKATNGQGLRMCYILSSQQQKKENGLSFKSFVNTN